MSDENLYTLEEAERELRARDCRTFGHHWEIVFVTGEEIPVSLLCSRCGRTAKVIDE